MVSNDTNSGVCAPGRKLESRPVYFTLKSLSLFAGMIAMAVVVLFFLIRAEVRPVAQDLAHHSVTDDQRDGAQAEKTKALEEEHKGFVGQLHKLDVKIERLAPPFRVRDLPANLRAPLHSPVDP